MKKTEILDTENCVELISGLCLRIRECESEIHKAQDEDTRQKWFDRMERAKELNSTLVELVRNRLHRQQLAEIRRHPT
jgi:hypothetical protein